MKRLVPSPIWLGLAGSLWRRLGLRDRAICLAAVVLPPANQFSTLLCFWVAIRLIGAAMRGDLTISEELLFGGALAAAFLFSELVHAASCRTDLSMTRITRRIARELRAEQLLRGQAVSGAPLGNPSSPSAVPGGDPVADLARTIQSFVKMTSMLFLVFALIGLIFFIAPVLAAAICLGGVGILAFLRNQVRPDRKAVETDRPKARRNLLAMEKDFREGKDPDPAKVAAYLENDVDRNLLQTAKKKYSRQVRVTVLSGIASAFAMSLVFVLVSRGYFEGIDPAMVVVMVLALRLLVSQGKTVMDKWAELHSERHLAGDLRNMAERSAVESAVSLGVPKPGAVAKP